MEKYYFAICEENIFRVYYDNIVLLHIISDFLAVDRIYARNRAAEISAEISLRSEITLANEKSAKFSVVETICKFCRME
jgi:hypothetical protein